MRSLITTPDILSVVLNWDPPLHGLGYITDYEISYSNRLDVERVSGESTSYRVTGLQPGVPCQFEVRAFINSLGGHSESINGTASKIGEGMSYCVPHD